MKYAAVLLAFLITGQATGGQNTFRATIKSESKETVAGATVSVKGTDITATTDANGNVELTNVPDGEQIVQVVSPGYEAKEVKLTFPLAPGGEHLILLRVHEFGEVTITSTTRISREIDDVPTRIEAISEEEVDEKINMRPSNVSMVLNE